MYFPLEPKDYLCIQTRETGVTIQINVFNNFFLKSFFCGKEDRPPPLYLIEAINVTKIVSLYTFLQLVILKVVFISKEILTFNFIYRGNFKQ